MNTGKISELIIQIFIGTTSDYVTFDEIKKNVLELSSRSKEMTKQFNQLIKINDNS